MDCYSRDGHGHLLLLLLLEPLLGGVPLLGGIPLLGGVPLLGMLRLLPGVHWGLLLLTAVSVAMAIDLGGSIEGLVVHFEGYCEGKHF